MVIYEHTVPAVAIVAGVGVAVVVSLAGYWLYTKRDWAMAAMMALRVSFLALLAWCLFLPGNRVVQTLQQKSRFVVLIDKSRSMTLTPAKEVTNRWQLAQAALQKPWVAAMAGKCDVEG